MMNKEKSLDDNLVHNLPMLKCKMPMQANTCTQFHHGKMYTKETLELAVMIDTFKPLKLTEEALKIDDGIYYQSWLEGQ